MKKLTLATTLLLSTTFGHAHGNDFDSQHCGIEINGHISMTDAQLNVSMANGTEILIDEQQRLFIAGQQQLLNQQQQHWVEDYYTGMYQAVPATTGLANDAIDLAGTAVNQVFSELFQDPSFGEELNSQLAAINQRIQQKFYADDGSIHLESLEFEDGNFVDDAWEQELESLISEYVLSSIGRLMVTVGTQLLTGSMDDFEQRIETFGEDIEMKLESQAVHLEKKAEALCDILKQVDKAETHLQDSIAGLSELDMVRVASKHQYM